jgi:hypothetical protein
MDFSGRTGVDPTDEQRGGDSEAGNREMSEQLVHSPPFPVEADTSSVELYAGRCLSCFRHRDPELASHLVLVVWLLLRFPPGLVRDPG